MRFFERVLAIASLALSLGGFAHAAPTEVTPDEAREIAREAYVYGFSPVYAYRYLQDEVFNKKSVAYIGDFNKIRNYQRLNTPEDTMITPIADATYTRVWLDLRAEPIIVTLPEITLENRYYVMQAISLDHFNLDFTGTHTIGQEGGPIVYVGPRHSGPIPKGIGRVVQSPSDFVYLQGRILVLNPDDMKNVIELQNGITIKTLSETLGQPAPKPAEKFELKPWTSDDEALRSVKTLDYLAYVLQYISLQTPDEQLLREKFAGVGAGIFGNSPAEAVYVGATMTAGKAGEKYVLTFPKGQLPPVTEKGFWSITMYDLPQRLIFHNPIERYALGNRSPGLKPNEDGSLSIYLQADSPGKDKEANWLPTPPGGPFFYVVRLYLPATAAQDGTWKDPKPVLAQ